ncbi:MAG TPA: SDR family oxidoreductase [Burkholderiales bacterium]|jgi:NAD(P)-dependent dehydrogenase (short-subunit alcohol dehydrogenase family)
MKEFKDKVAVVTGGASGLGLAMARRFAAEGMKLVLADIEEEALRRVELELRKAGVPVIGIWTDVSRSQDIERLAEKTLTTFGAAHVLCNNAGVAPGGAVWENTVADWEWVLGVNVWGVIHGVRTFLPIMLRQDTECHVVNTASVAGLLSVPNMGIYCVSKHAVVTLSECLHHDLAQRRAKIGVSVLCPAYVPTGIVDSERNRPALLRNPPRTKTAEELAREEQMRHAVLSGRISAEQVAEKVFEAVRHDRFYILTHPKIKAAIQARMEDILLERRPTDMSKPGDTSKPGG